MTPRIAKASLARMNAAVVMTKGLRPPNRKSMLLSLWRVGMIDGTELSILIGQLGLVGE